MAEKLLSWDQYATRWASLHGGVDPRRASSVIRGWLRWSYRLGWVLGKARVAPAAVTAANLLFCLAVPVVCAFGGPAPVFGGLLVVLAAVADSLDGAVAVLTRRVTKLGYVYDSVADRLGELAWLVAFVVVGAPVWLVVVCGAVTFLHEYLRARATAAGMTEIGVVTVAERPTRVILAAVGLVLSGVGAMFGHGLSVGGMTVLSSVWLLLGLIGLVQLVVAVRAVLTRHPELPLPDESTVDPTAESTLESTVDDLPLPGF